MIALHFHLGFYPLPAIITLYDLNAQHERTYFLRLLNSQDYKATDNTRSRVSMVY